MLFSKKGLCQNIKKDSIPNGFVLSFGGGGQQPLGTLNNRFTIGGCLNFKGLYRTKTNVFIGIEAEQMFGHRVKDTLLLSALRNDYGLLIDNNGLPAAVIITGTGFNVSGTLGKLWGLNRSKNQGIIALNSLGFIQHKIKINAQESNVPGLQTEYLKGYDYLSNGIINRLFFGYAYFGLDGRFNISAGLDYTCGFTKNRRDWNFDRFSKDENLYLDQMLGFKVYISFTFYRANPEGYHYY